VFHNSLVYITTHKVLSKGEKTVKTALFVCALVSASAITGSIQAQTTQQNAVPQQSAVAAATPKPVVSAAPVATPVEPVSTKIVPGSRVFIVPMDGFESYMAAAIAKKKVPLVPVADKEHADYVMTGTSVDKKAGWAKIVFMGNVHSDNAASVTMTDVKTGAIVYAYAVDKKSTMHGQQTTAEACAKHLKGHIEGKE
jgi:hypothetical protein